MAIYLVTGAAGFIASRVCSLLLADGHIVVGVDNLNDYYDVRVKDHRLFLLMATSDMKLGSDPKVSIFSAPKNGVKRGALPKAHRSGNFVFYNIDIEDRETLMSLFEEYKFDAVLNLAARAGVRYSMIDPFVYLRSNAEGTLNILECQRLAGVKKHVLASTSSLYAGCEPPFSEDQPVNSPLSPYAASKKAAEMLAFSYHSLYGIDVSVLRFFTVFGPAGRPDMSVFRFIKAVDEGGIVSIFGDGSQTRDFTHVNDIAKGVIAALVPTGYEVINLGGGRSPMTLRNMLGVIERALGKEANIRWLPFQEVDMRETWADVRKAERILHWIPEISVEDGLLDTVRWHRENAGWLKDIAV